MRTLPLATVWLLAFAVRGLYLWQIADAPFFGLRLGDAEAYHEWARRIAAGDWLGTGVFYQAPLYPYCLALIYSTVGESVAIVRLFQAMLGASSCVLLGAAGIALFGRTGLAAGLGLAIYPSAIFYDGLLDKTSLIAFLVTALLWLLVTRGGASARWPWLRWLGAGAVLGLLTLTRENALILSLPILVFALVTTPVRAPAACFLIGLLIVLIPSGLRNLWRGGEFQLTTAQLGPNLYIGNRPGASGTYEPLVVGHGSAADEREDATRLAQQALGHPPTPREVSRSSQLSCLSGDGRRTASIARSHRERRVPPLVATRGGPGHFSAVRPAPTGVVVPVDLKNPRSPLDRPCSPLLRCCSAAVPLIAVT